MAWLPGYSYRKPLVLTGGASGAQTDFQLDIDIAHVAAKMQADFDDIRFTQNNGTTLVDAWLESKVDSASAKTWAEFPTTPANGVNQTYYMYYGKVVANYWDGAATFLDYIISLPGYTNQPTFSVNTAIRFRAEFTATNQQYGYSIGSTDPRHIIYANTGQNPDIQYYNAVSGYVDIGAGDVNSGYHIYDIMRNSTTNVKTQYDDGAINTHPIDNTNAIARESYGTFNFSWGIVRKYAANPPTYAFGAEESAPTVGVRPPRIFTGPFTGPLGGPI